MKTLLATLLMMSAALAFAKPTTRTITDAKGRSVDIPLQAAKIAVLSELDLDALLALGVTPAATLNGRGQGVPPRYLSKTLDEQSKGKGVEVVGNLYQPMLAKIVKVRPDLILMGGWAKEGVLEQLQKIAPTVVTYGRDANWRKALTFVGDVVNKKQAAKDFLAAYDKKAADLKAKLQTTKGAKKGTKTVSVVRWNPTGPVYMKQDSFAHKTLADIGFALPKGQVGKGIHSKAVSLENLGQIDGDWIFLGTLAGKGEAQKELEKAKSSPVYKNLAAVKNGKVIAIDGSLWTSIGGPLAARSILGEVEANLLGHE